MLFDPGVRPGQALAQRCRRLPAEDALDHGVVGIPAADAHGGAEVVATLDLEAGDPLDDS